MYSNAGPTPVQINKDLPNYLEVSNAPLNNHPTSNQQYVNNQSNYNNYPNKSNFMNPSNYNNNYPQQNVIYVPQQVIVLHKKPSFNDKDFYPSMSVTNALAILIINVFFPGIGTMFIGCISGKNVGYWICIGLCQVLLSFIIIGWIWAIVTGVMLLTKADAKHL
jgi:hypothetical protein